MPPAPSTHTYEFTDSVNTRSGSSVTLGGWSLAVDDDFTVIGAFFTAFVWFAIKKKPVFNYDTKMFNNKNTDLKKREQQTHIFLCL